MLESDYVKKVNAKKVYSSTGETHFILEEISASTHLLEFKKYSKVEIKRISRQEAIKPLALLREE
jgi:hypothetical protein